MYDPFNQTVTIALDLGKQVPPGLLNRLMKECGATLHYDVYSFRRQDAYPNWQSGAFLSVRLYCGGKEVEAQAPVDRIELQYPLATIGSEYVSKFVETSEALSKKFEAPLMLQGVATTKDALIAHCDSLISELMDQWGEEPGSKELRIMIEQSVASRRC